MGDAIRAAGSGYAIESPVRPSAFNRKTLWLLIAVGVITWAVLQTGVFRENLVNAGGWSTAARFFSAVLHPDFSFNFLRLTLEATITTLAYAVLGIFLSTIFGFFGGILASETWWNINRPSRDEQAKASNLRNPWILVRAPLSGFRAIHEIIWGLFFINIFGLDPLTAILAIAIPFGAITSKVFSEILDETSHDPLHALLNSGVPPLPAFAYGLVPLALRDLISYSFYRFECAIRAAAVLGIIGAGGLGFQIFLSLKTLKYDQIWTLLFALFLLNGIADFWSGLMRRRLGAGRTCCNASLDSDVLYKSKPGKRAPQGDRLVKGSLIFGGVLLLLSFWFIKPDLSRLFTPNTIEQFSLVVKSSFPPDFSAFSFGEWFDFSKTTLAMSLLAITIAGLFSLVLSFPAAGNLMLPGGVLGSGRGGRLQRYTSVFLHYLARSVLLILRSIPAPIWALLLLFILFPGILPGAVALALYTLGVLGRLTAEAVENLDERLLSALKSSGSRGSQVFIYGILPMTMPRYIGYLFYRWDEAIRATVVVGLVGAGGLGWLLTEQLSSFDYAGVSATLIVFVAIIFLVDLVSARARSAFRG